MIINQIKLFSNIFHFILSINLIPPLLLPFSHLISLFIYIYYFISYSLLNYIFILLFYSYISFLLHLYIPRPTIFTYNTFILYHIILIITFYSPNTLLFHVNLKLYTQSKINQPNHYLTLTN
jgi:hypothetical protein